jgi:hypothetical protein
MYQYQETLWDYFCQGDIGDEKNGGILACFPSPEAITLTSLEEFILKSWNLWDDYETTELLEIPQGLERLREHYREMVAYHQAEHKEEPDAYPEDCHALYHINTAGAES